ncbi:glucan 1,4-alpha-glucosidase [Cryobacterium sp. MLB-32]|uniref:glucodextranase DOMON-like domain-containing protein n=1 Tax=Cryobacterium sp. MLB-32 TaxID=1529318 RepID=UPI0004E74277|nr:glucodextranase DOMON-like domain-containing protein [Cryobacterium sp. MLB-32]KFF60111.1 glucan 1,4-alpha-glucosidase [Cryobacterium sp. MLB-32]
MIRRRLVLPATIAALTFAAISLGPAASATPGSEAIGSPGVTSHQSLSRKDCVGTSRTTGSKIWFTVANGILSDVYAPTVDATNVETMQYLVTDGSSFTDLQSRDTTYTVASDPTGMTCTVTSTAKSGAYRLVNTYLTDPARDSVVVRTTFQPLTAAARNYQMFVRLDANAGGNGGGGTANGGADTAVVDTSTGSPVPVSFDTKTTSQANRTAYAVPSFVALTADRAFTTVSSGFVGTASDGLTQLDSTHALASVTTTATAGNVEQTVGIRRDHDGQSTLALGFGTTQASSVKTARDTARSSIERMTAAYVAGWSRYDAGLTAPRLTGPSLTGKKRVAAITSYYQSANVVKASEDKTYPGAIVAGLDAPWGQSIAANDPNNLFVGGYKEVFARDLYEAWTALYTDGDIQTARDTVRYLLLTSQQANGSQPRNSLLDGTKAADAFNDQLDETAYPILMALQSGLAGDDSLWPHVKSAANFLVSHGPNFGVERWEEQTGYSPSTIAAEIAGLVAAATIADQHQDPASARVWRATADSYQRTIKTWGVTTTGPLSPDPYFIRLSKTGDPNAAISYNVGNGGPTLDQRAIVDAGFLEYVRLGILPATDPVIVNSLKVTDGTIQRPTNSGPGWLRYNGDGYGDCFVGAGTNCTVTGAPWTNNFSGTGHPWPVLGAERAQQYLAQGQPNQATSVLLSINQMNSGPGLVPEQVWDRADVPASPYGTDPTTASIGFVNGKADGSASPLTWGSAAQVRLTADLAAGRSLEQPAQVRERYVSHTQGTTPLTVSSPLDGSATGTTTTVAGTAAAGATIDIADVATDADTATTLAKTTAAADGSFSVDVTSAAGTNVFVIASTAPNGGTAQVVRSVVNDVVDGTLLYSADDSSGDDNGPGNYAYPKAGDFHAGAFDLSKFQVYDTGATITFRVQTADLTPTFGSTNGAQLVDVYVSQPGAVTTSTASSYPGMNYTTVSPWSRLIEAQGFGNNRFVDAAGASVGAVTVGANAVSRYITFAVDKMTLGGTPASGWGFTVSLTGQDGTHGFDQTRSFSSTPGDYRFGVCAAASASALCFADPNTVPKVMDTIVPPGVSQASELDYTAGPVTLAAVVIP